MVLVGALVLILSSLALLMLLRIGKPIRQILQGSREAVRVMRDPDLDDREKEKLVQAQSLRTFRASFVILGQLVLALGLPYLLVLGLAEAGAWDLQQVLERSMGWDLLLGASVVAIALIRVLAKRPASEPAAP